MDHAPPACHPLHCHPLHRAEADWPLSNCSLDLWIEFLHRQGLAPEAAMAALVRLDDEGDQFTFCKFDQADISALYGLDTQELSLFDRLDAHLAVQTERDNLVLVELDAFHLPDTAATTYRRGHEKTLVGVTRIDAAAQRLSYLHNAGAYELGGEDYAALIEGPHRLFPYAEFVRRRGGALQGEALRDASLAALARQMRKAPERNPFVSYRARFGGDIARLAARPAADFHPYAFNHFRQFGAVFTFLAAYARWLAVPGSDVLAQSAAAIAQAAKLLQFRAARAAARRRPDACDAVFDELAVQWDVAFGWLRRRFG